MYQKDQIVAFLGFKDKGGRLMPTEHSPNLPVGTLLRIYSIEGVYRVNYPITAYPLDKEGEVLFLRSTEVEHVDVSVNLERFM